MHKILIIPHEHYPTHQSFMGEVYSKEDQLYKTVFLMRGKNPCEPKSTWNTSDVYLFPVRSKNILIEKIASFMRMDLRYAYYIPRIVYKEKINIIQIRDLTFPLLVALFCKLVAGTKVVYQKSFPMEYGRIDTASDPTRKFAKLRVGFRKGENIALHWLLRFTDAILPISKHMADNLHNDYNIQYSQMHPMGMGYNFAASPVLPKNDIQPPRHYRIIYVGTLEIYRQFEILLEGIAKVLEELDNVSFEFIGGRENEVKDLQQVTKTLAIDEKCLFRGHLSREEVYRKIGESHIGISWFGSHIQFQDASPTKMMEYLAIGVPLLAVDTVLMHKDFIDETEAGVLCPFEAQAVADCLIELVTNYSQYKKRALEAISYIKTKCSYESMRNEMLEIYNSLYSTN